MTITQRKLMSGYNRATASDHRRNADEQRRTENCWLMFVLCSVVTGAVLKVCGVI